MNLDDIVDKSRPNLYDYETGLEPYDDKYVGLPSIDRSPARVVGPQSFPNSRNASQLQYAH